MLNLRKFYSDLDAMSSLATLTSWAAVFTAFATGSLALLETMFQISRFSIALAFMSGLLGLLYKAIVRRQHTLVRTRKRTPPAFNVSFVTLEPQQVFLVVIEPSNSIPFKFDWKIVTENNIIVSGIHTEWGKVIPSPDSARFSEKADFDENKVTGDYIELRFSYRSIYAEEFPNESLSGKIRKAYKLTSDKKYCEPTELIEFPMNRVS